MGPGGHAQITADPSVGAVELLLQHFEGNAQAKEFARRLVSGVVSQRLEIDRLIAECTENWKLGRLAKVDLVVLRVATYELVFCPDIPSSVSMDEAIEIGKRFGSAESATFINVGYGDNQDFVVTGDRQISTSSFRNLHDAWLYMSQNIQHGDGGTCFGDSGGPTFLVDPSSHVEYIVAVTSWGDSVCKSTNNNYRVDLASSRSFIDEMIASNP